MDPRTSDLEIFIQKHFDKKVKILRKLPSFEDENFLCKEEQAKGTQMVLKLMCERPYLSEDAFKRQLKSRIDCVGHLKLKGFKCSEFVFGKDGQCVQGFKNSTGHQLHLSAVLYSFLPGKELEHSGYVYNKNVLFQVGAFLGCFHAAFEDFNHDSSLLPSEDNAWHFSNYGLLLEDLYISIVEDQTILQKLVSLLGYVKREIDMVKGVLRKGVLHGDFQGLNVIVPEDFALDSIRVKFSPSSHPPRFCNGQSTSPCVADTDSNSIACLIADLKRSFGPLDSKELLGSYGLIDYEDITYSYLVLEVGRAVADAMVTYLAQSMCKVDPSSNFCALEEEPPLTFVKGGMNVPCASIKSNVLKIGGFIICGYLVTNDLSNDEYGVILPAVLTSLCQYYILGLKAMKENPSNSQYVGYCSKEALILIEWLHNMKSCEIYQLWREAAHDLISILKQN